MKRNRDSFHIKMNILLLLLLIQSVSLSGITLYMKDMVVMEHKVVLGDLVAIKGAPQFLATQIREFPLPLSTDTIHLLPSRYIRDLISRFTEQAVIISGTKTSLIPHVLYKEMGQHYTREFIPFLISSLCKKDNRVEIDVITTPLFFFDSPNNDYTFRLYNRKIYSGYVMGDLRVEGIAKKNSKPGEIRREDLLSEKITHEDFISGKIPTVYVPDDKVPEEGFSREKTEWELTVHQHIPVIKAKKTLEKNQDLSWDNLLIAEEHLTPFTGQVLFPNDPITGYITTKQIPGGETLYTSSIKKSLKVRAGEKVFITFKKGNIRLSMTGRAGDSGSIGDRVKVRPSQSTEWVFGQVTGNGEVHVEL